eukprot:6192122-Pleurochrysis_carterae.AAC.1
MGAQRGNMGIFIQYGREHAMFSQMSPITELRGRAPRASGGGGQKAQGESNAQKAAQYAVMAAKKGWNAALLVKETAMMRNKLVLAVKMPTLSRGSRDYYVS